MSLKPFKNFDLTNYNTFKVKSSASVVYFPESEEDVIELFKEDKTPLVLGSCSNVLFSSRGIKAPLVFLKNLNKTTDLNDIIYVEAGVKSPVLSKWALDNSLTGFEFLAPIPSTVGGNIFMNSSAHNQSISDILVKCRVLNKITLEIEELEELDFGYRTSIFSKNPEKYVILGGYFKKNKENKTIIQNRIEEILEIRRQKQPNMKTPNAGSIFKNPKGYSAGKLIEDCNLKGETIGGATVSTVHANFIVNKGNATSDDIVNLMSKIQENVYNKFKIMLKPEIIFIGDKTNKEEDVWQQ